jgi:hypothetical protein
MPAQKLGSLFGLVFLLLAAVTPRPQAASPSNPAPNASYYPGRLDQRAIHIIYSEGNFETVIAKIDSFTQANPTYGKDDSIFIAKHFAVIYTANPATREKGKGYMFRLLSLLPSAKIVDMFVSEEIDRIFEKVREEYVVRQQFLGNSAPTLLQSSQYASGKMSTGPGDKTTGNPPISGKPEPGYSRRAYWVAGTVLAFAAAGSICYFMNQSEPKEKSYDVPR